MPIRAVAVATTSEQRRSRLTAVIVWAAASCLVLIPSLASAQTYPPQAATCGVSSTTLVPGGTVTILGEGFPPGSTVDLILEPGAIELGSAVADDDGAFSVVVRIPSDLAPGTYALSCSGVRVEGLGVAAGPAFTGSDLDVPLWVALMGGSAVAGVLLLLLGRARRATG